MIRTAPSPQIPLTKKKDDRKCFRPKKNSAENVFDRKNLRPKKNSAEHAVPRGSARRRVAENGGAIFKIVPLVVLRLLFALLLLQRLQLPVQSLQHVPPMLLPHVLFPLNFPPSTFNLPSFSNDFKN